MKLRFDAASLVTRRFAAGQVRMLAVAGLLLTGVAGSATAAQETGSATGLPVPRYVSLKSDRVNLREGPSKDHRTTWVFQRAGMPVEIIAEFEIWRRIRDSEGTEGWVLHSLLSGRRTGVVTARVKTDVIPLREKPAEASGVVAQLQTGVVGSVKACNGQWCRFYGQGFDGWIPQERLWGVYPAERLD
ncbi:MAG: SH3 domain-containing protein [Beijerinckiaceae bacterium]